MGLDKKSVEEKENKNEIEKEETITTDDGKNQTIKNIIEN